MTDTSELQKYGFENVGFWQKDPNDSQKIFAKITKFEDERVIYAFAESKIVRYIGIVKSSKRTFKKRLAEYRSPYTNGKGSTNREVGIKIIELLKNGVEVAIFALKPNQNTACGSYNGLEVDLISGLESSLIEKFNLANSDKGWNKSS